MRIIPPPPKPTTVNKPGFPASPLLMVVGALGWGIFVIAMVLAFK